MNRSDVEKLTAILDLAIVSIKLEDPNRERYSFTESALLLEKLRLARGHFPPLGPGGSSVEGTVAASVLLHLAAALVDQDHEDQFDREVSRSLQSAINASIVQVNRMMSTGPGGYHPAPTFEKCNECNHWKILK